MYILKNSIKSIWRNRGRSILTGAVMLITVAVISSALSINRAAVRAISEYRDKYGSIVTVSPDIDKLIETGPGQQQSYQSSVNIAGITPGQYEEFAQSALLKGSSIEAVMPAASSTLKAVETEKSGAVVAEPMPGAEGATMPTMKIVGVAGTAGPEDFTQGLRKITFGRMYQNDGECVVSADLASLNDLHVGDTITVINVTGKGQPTLSLTVTGVYSDSTNNYGGQPLQYSYMNRRNEILTTLETVAGTEGAENPGVSIQAAYYLKDPGLLKTFAEELRRKGLPDAYSVNFDSAGFEMTAGPAMRLKTLSVVAAAAAAVLGGTAIVLITLAGLRRRRQELAALRLMGMKQGRLARGLLYETLLIALVCTFLGVAAGAATAQPAANAMMKLHLDIGVSHGTTVQPVRTSMILMTRSSQNVGISIGGAEMGSAEPENIKVDFDPAAMLEAALAAMALAAAAAAAAVRFAGRNGPMKTLTKKH